MLLVDVPDGFESLVLAFGKLPLNLVCNGASEFVHIIYILVLDLFCEQIIFIDESEANHDLKHHLSLKTCHWLLLSDFLAEQKAVSVEFSDQMVEVDAVIYIVLLFSDHRDFVDELVKVLIIIV